MRRVPRLVRTVGLQVFGPDPAGSAGRGARGGLRLTSAHRLIQPELIAELMGRNVQVVNRMAFTRILESVVPPQVKELRPATGQVSA